MVNVFKMLTKEQSTPVADTSENKGLKLRNNLLIEFTSANLKLCDLEYNERDRLCKFGFNESYCFDFSGLEPDESKQHSLWMAQKMFQTLTKSADLKSLLSDKNLEMMFDLMDACPVPQSETKASRILNIVLELLVNTSEYGGGNQSNEEEEKIRFDSMYNSTLALKLFESLNDQEAVQKKIISNLLGVIALNTDSLLKAFGDEKTAQEASLLYCIKECFKSGYKKDLSPECLGVLFTAVFRNLGLEPRILNKPKEGVKENNEDEKEEIAQSVPSPQNEVSVFSRVLESLDDQKQINPLDQDKLLRYERVFTSICDGSVFRLILDTVIKDANTRTFLVNLIKYQTRFMDSTLRSYGDEASPFEEYLKDLEASISALKSMVKDSFWRDLLDFVPEVIRLCLLCQDSNRNGFENITQHCLALLRKIIKAAGLKQNQFFSDVINCALGSNIDIYSEQDSLSNITFKMEAKERRKLLFSKVLPTFFPSLGSKKLQEDFELIYDIILRLNGDFLKNINNPEKRKEAFNDVLLAVAKLTGVKEELVSSLVNLLDGDLEGCKIFDSVVYSQRNNYIKSTK